MNLTERDLVQIKQKGISAGQVLSQLEIFRQGVRYTRLDSPATVTDGIKLIPEDRYQSLLKLYERAVSSGRFVKFVPASGAASRMFSELQKLLHQEGDFSLEELQRRSDSAAVFGREFFSQIDKFAFCPDLKRIMQSAGWDFHRLLRGASLKTILEYLLTDKGLNYAELPKGLIQFHRYGAETRTAFQENILEAVNQTCDKNGTVRLHFTVPEEWEDTIIRHCRDYCKRIAVTMEIKEFAVSFSRQKSSTDTITADMNNKPLRDDEGRLVFRPGGHGALIENLAELQGDLVYINNIDNLRPDRLKADTYLYRKLLGGLLIELQNRVFKYLRILESGKIDDGLLKEIELFLQKDLNADLGGKYMELDNSGKVKELFRLLNRPLRVCGMVKNIGAPGGGPFWVKNSDGTISLQIVETPQIDLSDDRQRRIFQASTHFNPVDLVCGMKDYRNNQFDLKRFIDQDAVFISRKPQDGGELQALELPGLWNGAMAKWNTVFIETPLTTFSPVKTVNDLLQPVHQE